ncbi:glycosyltransferase [Streptomyces fractus]|uniref:glycosyltransferase n=1 Tax=Streptomyces fractus TaxID=641806 RepID=UPI003CF078A2
MSEVVAVIPAHNEAPCIANAIRGLATQSVPPDRIVVVADNCTDSTAAISRGHGAGVFETTGNTAKKAGALNQFLRQLPMPDPDARILVTDADSVLDPTFIETALGVLADSRYGGVGGVFRGDQGAGFVGHLQRNEYARYARDVRRRRGRCLVLTGTAAMFPVRVLNRITAGRRNGTLPSGDGEGGVYDTRVMTEDNELSFAIMHLGFKILAPRGCTLTTEVMPTWQTLWEQRRRWKAGAVQNCIQYGITRVTARYWGRQLFTMLGIVVTLLYLATIAASLSLGGFHVHPMWAAASGVFIAERAISVRDRGWRQMLLSASMYELVLDFFLQTCHIAAYFRVLTNRAKVW